MPNITISELYPLGSDLFQDSESFLNELTNNDMVSITAAGISYQFVSASAVVSTVNFGNVSIVNGQFNSNTVNANTIGNRNP